VNAEMVRYDVVAFRCEEWGGKMESGPIYLYSQTSPERGQIRRQQKRNYKKRFQSMVIASLVRVASGKKVPDWLLQMG